MEKAFEPRVQSTAFLRLLLFSGFQKLWSFRPMKNSTLQHGLSEMLLVKLDSVAGTVIHTFSFFRA